MYDFCGYRGGIVGVCVVVTPRCRAAVFFGFVFKKITCHPGARRGPDLIKIKSGYRLSPVWHIFAIDKYILQKKSPQKGRLRPNWGGVKNEYRILCGSCQGLFSLFVLNKENSAALAEAGAQT